MGDPIECLFQIQEDHVHRLVLFPVLFHQQTGRVYGIDRSTALNKAALIRGDCDQLTDQIFQDTFEDLHCMAE